MAPLVFMRKETLQLVDEDCEWRLGAGAGLGCVLPHSRFQIVLSQQGCKVADPDRPVPTELKATWPIFHQILLRMMTCDDEGCHDFTHRMNGIGRTTAFEPAVYKVPPDQKVRITLGLMRGLGLRSRH